MFCKKIPRLAINIIRITGSLIFLYLCRHALGRNSYYILPETFEYPLITTSSVFFNLAAFLFALLSFSFLSLAEQKLKEKQRRILPRITLISALVWAAVFIFWWIGSADRVPVGDQAFLYGGASYFQEGGFSFLQPGGYCNFYPHQLPLMALCELLFLFVGTYNYHAIEIIMGIFAFLCVWLGHRILSEFKASIAVLVFYDLLIMGCLPLFFYTPWCYGDIPGLFLALLAFLMLIRYSSSRKIRYLVFLSIALIFAVFFRNHSYILLTAFLILSVIHWIQEKDFRIFLCLILTFLLIRISYLGIYKMYEIRSGYPHLDGLPVSSWIAMGLQDDGSFFPGWYNNFAKEIFGANDHSMEQTDEVARWVIRERWNYFLNDPAYACTFFRKKILSQWNQPLYQSLFFNTNYSEGMRPEEGSLADRMSGDAYFPVLRFCIKWQIIIYVGMLFYFLFAVNAETCILRQGIALTIIGGFFFSIIWEAMARYIFPYYVMMFPFAAIGYQELWNRILLYAKKFKANRKTADK